MSLETKTQGQLATDDLVVALKAVAEPTRLRILMLLCDGELNVKDLTQVLDQSQPRLSRHLKLLNEAGLVERFREGSWVYFHISQSKLGGRLALQLLKALDRNDPVLARDRRRLANLKQEREAAAQEYFAKRAADWDSLRSLHVSEDAVEAAMCKLLGPGPFKYFVDLGTGTGRVLQLFAQSFDQGLGIDVNNKMLSYARSKLDSAGRANIQLRHADIYNVPLPDNAADAVVMHQVLHYLSDPSSAISEACRILRPGGHLLIVDFAPHELEFLRNAHAHERLGFSKQAIDTWLANAGLRPDTFEQLTPAREPTDNLLTVSLWLGVKENITTRTKPTTRTAPTFEETS